MYKMFLGAMLLFGTLLFQACGSASSDYIPPDKSETSVILPLYSYPTEWEDNKDLSDLIDATTGKIIAIVNPLNGPGLVQNIDYVNGIDYLVNKDVTVVGYIYTSYGDRDKEEIYDDIDAYVSFYGSDKLSGVFFDEVDLSDSDNEAFVRDISAYAKSKNLRFIVLNPGTFVEQSIIDEDYYDMIITYENSYDKYLFISNDLNSSVLTKQGLLVYAYPDLISYTADIQKAKDMHFDYIYFTTDTEPNPWDTVFNFLK